MTFTIYNALTVLLTLVLAAASFALLLERRRPGAFGAGSVSRAVARVGGPRALTAWTWVPVAAAVAVGYGAIVSYDLATGLYACHPGPGTADLIALTASGRSFWSGGDPFSVTACGASVQIPYGLAAVVVDALGSLGGAAGVAAIWGLVSVAIVPLVWSVADRDRRYVTVLAASSPIYFPLVASQIDGASNAIVPVGVLLAIVLARRRGLLGPAVGGLLATARFPALFGVLAAAGAAPRRFVLAAAAAAAFVGGTALAYARWRHDFVNVVFLSQVTRRSFSLNAFGVLLDHHALPASTTLTVVQAGAVLAVTAAAFFLVRSPVRSAAIALTAVALLSQFLSFSILLWLVPVVLVGARERWWLWGIGLVGAVNYDLALNVVAWSWGNYLPTDVLDVAMTVLLAGLFVELWRGAWRERSAPSAGPGRPVGAAAG